MKKYHDDSIDKNTGIDTYLHLPGEGWNNCNVSKSSKDLVKQEKQITK